MSEQQTTRSDGVNDGAKKAPATFHAILGEKIGMTQVYHPKDQQPLRRHHREGGPVPDSARQDGRLEGRLQRRAARLRQAPRQVLLASRSSASSRRPASPPQRYVTRDSREGHRRDSRPARPSPSTSVFKLGDYVDVQGICKGKGFAGVMKRHNFRGLPASHGASDKQRSPGSLASRRSLGRVHARPAHGRPPRQRRRPRR